MKVVKMSVFLHPLSIVFLLFIGQALFWFFFMPDVPTVPGLPQDMQVWMPF